MKNIIYLFMIIGSCWSAKMDAQNATQSTTPIYFNETSGYNTFGIDIGLSYQSSDVKSKLGGWGAGITLEHNLIHETGALLDIGIRGRLLYANSIGIDTKKSTGILYNQAVNGTNNTAANYKTAPYYYANHKTQQGEIGAEAVITLNKLREQTGLYATLFGGFGLDFYSVKVDQLNGSGAKYNYTTLGSTPSVSDVKNLLDGTFETAADSFAEGKSKFAFMPNIGIELGYHFSPRFLVSLGHKLTFSTTDLLDGQQWLDNNTIGGKKDIHHYTNLQFKWILSEKKTRQGEKPKIKIIRPITSPLITTDDVEILRARIIGVSTKDDITITVNGRPVRFDYYNEELTSEITLSRGDNTVVIRAENSAGVDTKQVIFRQKEKETPRNTPTPEPPPPPRTYPTPDPTPTPQQQPPIVRFLKPIEYSETEIDRVQIQVQTTHVQYANDVSVKVNGQTYTNFTFRNNEVTANIPLVKGQNTITVSGSNSVGTASKDVYITLKQAQPLPIVRITNIGTPVRQETMDCRSDIEARIENIGSKSDIQLMVNGRSVYDFDYDNYTKILRGGITLGLGTNTVEIIAKNNMGEARDSEQASCQQAKRLPPTVNINTPTNGTTVEDNRIDVKAIVQNITAQNQVEFYLNNNKVTDFQYYNYDKSVTARVNLVNGENNIKIRVTNNDGSDEATTRVYLKERRLANPPTVYFTRPTNNATVTESYVNIEAKTTDITSKSQIQLSVNRTAIRDFTFNMTNNSVMARVNIGENANTITINVQNDVGSKQASVIVNKLGAIQMPIPPKISIVQPSNNAVTKTSNITVLATTVNIGDKSQIHLFLNNQDVSNFTFDYATRSVKANLTLVEGQNIIKIIGSNKDGSSEDTKTVTYEKIVIVPKPPVVTLLQPTNGTTTNENTVSLNASLTNITENSQVKVLVNGVVVPVQIYAWQQVRGVINLVEGNNIITVRATNKDGVDSKTTSVTYIKVRVITPDTSVTDRTINNDLPVIEMPLPEIKSINASQPVVDPFDTTPPVSIVTSTILYVDAKNKIDMYVNGTSITDFTYNVDTKQLRWQFTIVGGRSYTIYIKATNDVGSVNKTEVVKF